MCLTSRDLLDPATRQIYHDPSTAKKNWDWIGFDLLKRTFEECPQKYNLVRGLEKFPSLLSVVRQTITLVRASRLAFVQSLVEESPKLSTVHLKPADELYEFQGLYESIRCQSKVRHFTISGGRFTTVTSDKLERILQDPARRVLQSLKLKLDHELPQLNGGGGVVPSKVPYLLRELEIRAKSTPVQYLLGYPHPTPSLTVLIISNGSVGADDDWIELFRHIGPTLRILRLGSPGLSSDRVIDKSRLPKLETFAMQKSQISLSYFELFADFAPSLHTLDLYGSDWREFEGGDYATSDEIWGWFDERISGLVDDIPSLEQIRLDNLYGFFDVYGILKESWSMSRMVDIEVYESIPDPDSKGREERDCYPRMF